MLGFGEFLRFGIIEGICLLSRGSQVRVLPGVLFNHDLATVNPPVCKTCFDHVVGQILQHQ